MTNTVVSRLGQINKAGNDDSLFLKQFGGEVLTEFMQETKFKDRHFVRQISNGKSAQFPMIGTIGSAYHTPGNWIDGLQVGHAERVITIEGLLYSSLFIQQIDELENHYDVRGPYSTEMGRELARQYDRNVARVGVLAARQATSDLTGRAGGTVITNAAMLTTSAALSAALWTSASTFDTKNISESDRWGFFRPAQFYLMAQDTTLINTLYGGAGSVSEGVIKTLAGIDIIKTNNLPAADDTANSNIHANYRADYSKVAGLVMNRMAVGTVQLMDISMESEWEIRRQGYFFISKMAVGHGILRSDCAISLQNT